VALITGVKIEARDVKSLNISD